MAGYILSCVLFAAGLFLLLCPKTGKGEMKTKPKWNGLVQDYLEDKREQIMGRKPSAYEKFRARSVEVLKQSNSGMSYRQYLKLTAVLAVTGIGAGLLLNNIFLAVILGCGMIFVPLGYLTVKQASYRQYLDGQIARVLSIITNTYIQCEDIVSAVRENLHRIDRPLKNVFAEFVASKTFVDSNTTQNIRRMKGKVENQFFRDWCDTLILCQNNRELKFTLPTIIEKMGDVQEIQAELNTTMYNIYKEHITVTVLVLIMVPFLKVLNPDWYALLTETLPGQAIVAVAFLIAFLTTAYVIKKNRPVSDF